MSVTTRFGALVLGFLSTATAAPPLAVGFEIGVFGTNCIVRDESVGGTLDAFSAGGFELGVVGNCSATEAMTCRVDDDCPAFPPNPETCVNLDLKRDATHTATLSKPGWDCAAAASLDGPKIEFIARLDDPPPLAYPQGLAFGAGSNFTYAFEVKSIGSVPAGVTMVPVNVIGKVEVTARISAYDPPVFASEASGEIVASIFGEGFPSATQAVLGFFYSGGAAEYTCNGKSVGAGRCALLLTLPGEVPLNSVRKMTLAVSLPGGLASGARGVRLDVGGMADPIIEVDPDAEFELGVRYADLVTVEVSEGVVQMPEPSGALAAGEAALCLAVLRRRRRSGLTRTWSTK